MSIVKIFFIAFFSFLTLFTEISCNSNKEKNISHNIDIKRNTTDTNEKKVHFKEDSILKSIGMVNIADSIPDIVINIKYASDENFLGFNFYNGFDKAYVQVKCLKKLKKAWEILQKENPDYRFIIFDAARSKESQQIMWDSLNAPIYKKHWYVANPQRGSIHNYGMAIDLSIVDKFGNLLDMGTCYDFFGDLANPYKTEYFYKCNQLSSEQYKNRILLMNVMKKAGFSVANSEWWHYNASSLKYAKENFRIYSIKILD